jgi:putative sterol carrier protein
VPKFLSDEWQEQAKAIREEYAGEGAAAPHKVKMNLVVTDAPDDVSSGDIEAHMDSSDGELKLDNGHIADPELTVTLDYETAKAILVEQNPQAGMQAFMAGKIKVTGDMTKLMAMQSAAPDPNQQAIADRIKAITD